MLVINANNQQDTTNYMVGNTGYPDLDSILMWGCPHFELNNLVNFVAKNADEGHIALTPNDIVTVDTIGSYPINMYSTKANKYLLYSGQSFHTNTIALPSYTTYIPDLGLVTKSMYGGSGNSGMLKKLQFGYNLAVKGLDAGLVIGEKIYAPLLLGGLISSNDISNGIYWSDRADFYSPYIATITFVLLHTDGTTTPIATIDLTLRGGRMAASGNVTLKYVTTDQYATATPATQLSGRYNSSFYGQGLAYCQLEGYYSGTGQTTQAGDCLVAEVRINVAYGSDPSTSSVPSITRGVFGGGANNNDMRDLYGFRPFQVSIRDA